MNLSMKCVGESVALEASGTPAELAEYSRLSGVVSGGDGSYTHSMLVGPAHGDASSAVVDEYMKNVGFRFDTDNLSSLSKHLR